MSENRPKPVRHKEFILKRKIMQTRPVKLYSNIEPLNRSGIMLVSPGFTSKKSQRGRILETVQRLKKKVLRFEKDLNCMSTEIARFRSKVSNWSNQA